eukprot:1161866-Pelagomonas_calceolata.AAC.5
MRRVLASPGETGQPLSCRWLYAPLNEIIISATGLVCLETSSWLQWSERSQLSGGHRATSGHNGPPQWSEWPQWSQGSWWSQGSTTVIICCLVNLRLPQWSQWITTVTTEWPQSSEWSWWSQVSATWSFCLVIERLAQWLQWNTTVTTEWPQSSKWSQGSWWSQGSATVIICCLVNLRLSQWSANHWRTRQQYFPGCKHFEGIKTKRELCSVADGYKDRATGAFVNDTFLLQPLQKCCTMSATTSWV